MNHNPYSPPNAMPADAEGKCAFLCTAMFWLSSVFCVVMFGIAANGGYQYWVYTSQMGIALPAHILAATVCVAGSGFGMLYSAITWRRQLARAAAISFGCSLVAFFVGPPLLPLLM